MARMHPEDIDDLESATVGERKVFRFLREVALPDKEFIGWYEPTIGDQGREPDFILFGESLGLIVLEVKDWDIDQIGEVDPHTFKIWIAGKEETRTNPDRQAKGYVNDLMDLLKNHPEFRTGKGMHEGQLKIPIGRMVVFPHISLKDYQDRRLGYLIPFQRTLFQDDLAPDGEICCDPSGEKFKTRLAGVFPFPFHGLSGKEVHLLNSLIYPALKFIPPKRSGTCKMRFQQEVQALDETQARAALTLKAGRRLIKGPPGSGKTLVLIHRCCLLQKYKTGNKRILLVCYNIALVSYLKRLLQEKGVGVGGEGVQVHHFYNACSMVLDMKVEYDKPDSDYYDYIVQTTLEALGGGLSEVGTFDVILVDEGQDFSDDMLKVILGLLKPAGDLVITLDDFQDLYRREGSWKSLGIEARGGSRNLQRIYRNTEPIARFARRFIGEVPSPQAQLKLFPGDLSCTGPDPEIIRFENEPSLEEFLVRDIQKQHKLGEFKMSEIAILYDDKVYGPEGFRYERKEFPGQILKKLESAGIPTNWVSQDIRAKELFDITTDRVSLISIHSAKGLDFDLVYLVGVDRIIPTDETRERLIRLIYVAITRARYRLVIPYVEETEFIGRLKASLTDSK